MPVADQLIHVIWRAKVPYWHPVCGWTFKILGLPTELKPQLVAAVTPSPLWSICWKNFLSKQPMVLARCCDDGYPQSWPNTRLPSTHLHSGQVWCRVGSRSAANLVLNQGETDWWYIGFCSSVIQLATGSAVCTCHNTSPPLLSATQGLQLCNVLGLLFQPLRQLMFLILGISLDMPLCCHYCLA